LLAGVSGISPLLGDAGDISLAFLILGSSSVDGSERVRFLEFGESGSNVALESEARLAEAFGEFICSCLLPEQHPLEAFVGLSLDMVGLLLVCVD
jgi:hypothetical protein